MAIGINSVTHDWDEDWSLPGDFQQAKKDAVEKTVKRLVNEDYKRMSILDKIKKNSTIKDSALLSESKFFKKKDMIPT